MARPAVSFERVSYNESTGKVLVRSCKKVNGQRPVKAEYDALTFLALLVLQVPPPGTHMTRYYGWYSTRSRAKSRQAAQQEESGACKTAPKEIPSPEAKDRRRRWADLIRLVFEVNPLECECGGRLRFVTFITTEQPDVLGKILDHLGEPTEANARGPPKWYQLILAQEHVEANAHVYDGFDDGPSTYEPDAAWSQGEWENA